MQSGRRFALATPKWVHVNTSETSAVEAVDASSLRTAGKVTRQIEDEYDRKVLRVRFRAN